MQCELDFLAILMIARWCHDTRHPAVSLAMLWRAVIAIGEVDGAILFMETGETPDPDQASPKLQAIVDHMAETRQGLIDVVDGRVSLRLLGQDWIDATSDFTPYQTILEQFAQTIPTLTAV